MNNGKAEQRERMKESSVGVQQTSHVLFGEEEDMKAHKEVWCHVGGWGFWRVELVRRRNADFNVRVCFSTQWWDWIHHGAQGGTT